MSYYDYTGQRFSARQIQRQGYPAPSPRPSPRGQRFAEDLDSVLNIPQRVNKAHSFTQTKTEEQKKLKMLENLPTGVSKGNMKVYVNPPLQGMLKGSIEYRDYYNYELSWQAGSKHFFNICNLGTKAQWTTQNVFTNMASEFNQNLFSLSPNQGQVGGSFVPGNTNPNSQKMGVSKADIKFDLINLSSLPCRVKISFYRVSQDTNDTILGKYNGQLANQQLLSTNFAVNSAIVTEPITGGNETSLSYFAGSATVPTNLAVIPYIGLMSRREVGTFFTHLKSHSIIMAPADIHTLYTDVDLNIFQRKELISESESNQFPVGSVQVIIELQGLATHIVIPESVGPPAQPAVNEITLGAGKVGVMISRHLNIKSMKTSEEKHDVTYIGRGANVVYGNVEQSSVIQDSNLSVQLGTKVV